MPDFRLLLVKVRHHPAVRFLTEAPDRLDDAVLAFLDRAAKAWRPRRRAAAASARASADRFQVRTAPVRQAAARAAGAGSRWLARVPPTCWFGLAMALMTVVPARLVPGGVKALCWWVGVLPAQLAAVPKGGADFLVQGTFALSTALLALVPLAALAAFLRNRAGLFLLKAASAGYLLLVLFLWRLVISVPAQLNASNPEVYQNFTRNELWVTGTWRVMPWFLLAIGVIFTLSLRPVRAVYGGAGDAPRWADRLWRDLRSHGADPQFRKALYWAASLHLFFIFILPFIMPPGCNESPYGVPQGSGVPVIETVRVKKLKKKPEKKYVLNMDSPISFYQPKLEDSEILETVDKETENTYEAQKLGKLGAGGGKQGGWPNGMKNARVRFIRLEYEGGDWDQDMGIGSDYNLLLKFRELTGFDIAPETESRPIAQLKRFPRNRAPPFVYLTGGLRGTINLSNAEIKILREYCLDMGGMIFADNGGGNFDRSFRPLMRRIFPDLPLVEISKDDAIYQQPFSFPNGAPPLWHHSGNNAMGVKYKGRWVVFYHQGDINDAWKTGHSGVNPGVAMQAYKLGVNVISYAFNQYMSLNFDGNVPK